MARVHPLLLDDPPRSRRALPTILPVFVLGYAQVTRNEKY
jgi:hypothetical protein